VVRAPRLTVDAILSALTKGDFYASTGVELADVQAAQARLTVIVKEQSSVKYTIVFVGKGGRVLLETASSPARYDFAGDEGYVRAKVIDSNGLVAWTQPVRVVR
jgi:predicted flavoprotein YhiN